MRHYEVDALVGLGRGIFEALGAPDDIAGEVALSLVAANLAGHDSHGIMRVMRYAAAVRAGQVDPRARPAVVADDGPIATVSGNWGFGQPAARVAAALSAEKARAHGIGAVAAIASGHFGRMGEWAELVAARGMLGLNLLGMAGLFSAAPHGGAARALGTNPLAFAAPAAGMEPVVADFATTGVAEGKLAVARAKGEPIPEGLIVDARGRPSTDPNDYYAGGALLPFGGHKGYAVALMIELLASTLTGADAHARDGAHSGALFLAFDPARFRPDGGYADAAAEVLGRVKAVPPAEGAAEVLLPGEPERRARDERRRAGIPLPDATVAELHALASELGVAARL